MQENTDSLMEFQSGDALLGALILAQQFGTKPVVDKVDTYNEKKPDPASFIGSADGDNPNKRKVDLNKAFAELTKNVNPDFNPSKQMKQTIIPRSYPNYPGSMSRHEEVTDDGKTYDVYNVRHNPGVDRVVYAHELGHVLGQNTPGARQINELRSLLQHNPKLTEAIDKGLQTVGVDKATAKSLSSRSLSPASLFKGSRYLAPAVAAGLTEGDEDLATSVAVSLAMSSPILLDEGIASMNALKIMDKAGDRASGQQRRRLAAAWGNYLAPALIAGLSGNVVGNLMD